MMTLILAGWCGLCIGFLAGAIWAAMTQGDHATDLLDAAALLQSRQDLPG
jgi:hypothetical protein